MSRPVLVWQIGNPHDSKATRTSSADTVTVTGPQGYQATANGFAGGPGDGPNQTIEAFVLPTSAVGYLAGEYFVTINDDHVIDVAGNLLPRQLLGSFVLTV